MEHAFPGTEPSAAVRRRLEWPDIALDDLLKGPPFELANRPTPGVDPVYALRLGNARYPHMKLQIQGWPNSDGYLLSVNTHDQVLTMATQPHEAEASRDLQAYNRDLKERIEQAWEEAELPTFNGYLRDYIAAHETGGGEVA